MKKLSVLLVFALLVTILAGCQGALGAMGGSAQTPPPVENQTPAPAAENTPAPAAESTAPPVADSTVPAVSQELISRDEAKSIALNHAEVKEADIRDLDIELDKDAGTLHYDVDFEVGGKDYDYEIDAVTGKILRSETPPKTDAKKETADKPKTEPKKEVTASEARNIALKHAGLKKADVRDLEVELDRDGGKKHFDVSFEKDGYDYEYEIDAATGKILKSEKERD